MARTALEWPLVVVVDVANPIELMRSVAGINPVGLGAYHDGILFTPKGREDVSTHPRLCAEVVRGAWTDGALSSLATKNVLRVPDAADAVAATGQWSKPAD